MKVLSAVKTGRWGRVFRCFRCFHDPPAVIEDRVRGAENALEKRARCLPSNVMFVRRKLVNGDYRHYAVWTFRADGKVRQRQIYLGKSSTIAERILALEEDLSRAKFMAEYCARKIARHNAPRPSLIEAHSGSARRLAAVKTALERLTEIGNEHGLLPTIDERAERAGAQQKHDEESALFFARRSRADAVVPTGIVSTRVS